MGQALQMNSGNRCSFGHIDVWKGGIMNSNEIRVGSNFWQPHLFRQLKPVENWQHPKRQSSADWWLCRGACEPALQCGNSSGPQLWG